MKIIVTLIDRRTNTERDKEFNSKKDMDRFFRNNYQSYSWKNARKVEKL